MDTAVIIVAAGSGSRARGGKADPPKQYWPLAGATVLERTLGVFGGHPRIGPIVTVIRDEDRALYDQVSAKLGDRLLEPVAGGATRQQSVRAGLEAIAPAKPAHVLIHDGVRPFVTGDIIDRVLGALGSSEAALAALPLVDTLKRAEDGRVIETVKREGLWRAQTPQAFRYDRICEAHEAASTAGKSDFTDDAQVAEWHGLEVAIVEGAPSNIKLTTAEDFAVAENMLLSGGGAGGEWRIGQGYDTHRFEPGDHMMLCGVRVPHTQTLKGHSDADVGLHAITDALLGAIGDGDIGTHFPPSDPKWRNAASDLFLKDAAERIRARGGKIANVDVTLICEAPKIGPHREAMRSAIAEILDLAPDRVGVKATTTEGLGYTGRSEGILAQASASVWLP